MNILVIIVAALLITSKFLDCYSTLKFYEIRGGERNPLARRLFEKIGVKKGVYFVWIISLITVIAVTYEVLRTNVIIYKVTYVIFGGIISYIQFMVARYNCTGNDK